jgi:hypothetical protein
MKFSEDDTRVVLDMISVIIIGLIMNLTEFCFRDMN